MLLTACGDLIFKQPSLQPGASPGPSASGTASPVTTPTASGTPRPSATPTGSATPSTQTTPDPAGLTSLLYLNLDAAPDPSVYKGATLSTRGLSSIADGKYGQAWHFEGQGSYLKIPPDIRMLFLKAASALDSP